MWLAFIVRLKESAFLLLVDHNTCASRARQALGLALRCSIASKSCDRHQTNPISACHLRTHALPKLLNFSCTNLPFVINRLTIYDLYHVLLRSRTKRLDFGKNRDRWALWCCDRYHATNRWRYLRYGQCIKQRRNQRMVSEVLRRARYNYERPRRKEIRFSDVSIWNRD